MIMTGAQHNQRKTHRRISLFTCIYLEQEHEPDRTPTTGYPKNNVAKNIVEINYSFTYDNLEQYTHQHWPTCRRSGSLSNIASKNPSKC